MEEELKTLIEKHFGQLNNMLEADKSNAFLKTYQTLTRVMKRDFMVEPPRVVKIDYDIS